MQTMFDNEMVSLIVSDHLLCNGLEILYKLGLWHLGCSTQIQVSALFYFNLHSHDFGKN
jgi:hypothetical protein